MKAAIFVFPIINLKDVLILNLLTMIVKLLLENRKIKEINMTEPDVKELLFLRDWEGKEVS